jgi:hypothetical protein
MLFDGTGQSESGLIHLGLSTCTIHLRSVRRCFSSMQISPTSRFEKIRSLALCAGPSAIAARRWAGQSTGLLFSSRRGLRRSRALLLTIVPLNETMRNQRSKSGVRREDLLVILPSYGFNLQPIRALLLLLLQRRHAYPQFRLVYFSPSATLVEILV